MAEFTVPECLLHSSDVSWGRDFTPKPQPIIPLTVMQISIPLIVSVPTFILSAVLFFLLPPIADLQLKVALVCALGLSFNGVILIIFAEYIFVSKWVDRILDRSSVYVRNVSFNALVRVMNKRLALMCGAGILFSVLGATSLFWSVTIYTKTWWLWAITGPMIAWASVELSVMELCN